MKLTKKTNNVLISSYNFEGFADVSWSLIIDPSDLSFSIEIPQKLSVASSYYDEKTDTEIPLNKDLTFSKIKLAKFEVFQDSPLELKKIEIDNNVAKVYLE